MRVRSLFHWWMGLSVRQTAFWLGGALAFLAIAAVIHFLR